MESAIPRHLQVTRTEPINLKEDYTPPFPAYTARFPTLVDQVVMAYFGAQGADVTGDALKEVTSKFAAEGGPGFWDLAECKDQLDLPTVIVVAYWDSPKAFDAWKKSSGFDAWWQDSSLETGPFGYFLEVVSPKADQFETLFSREGAYEGAACLTDKMSDQMFEHGYWGSTRDRIPAGQTSKLEGTSEPAKEGGSGKRVKVTGSDGLCLIRSGQDWTETTDLEREKYETEIAPVLLKGMNFLRDEGETIGCINCRFMTVVGDKGPVEKTYGLAHFVDLESLEAWAKNHKTHVAIFGGFMRYVQELNFNIQLKLWHEVTVVPAGAQYFEYINCHDQTGLLGQREL